MIVSSLQKSHATPRSSWRRRPRRARHRSRTSNWRPSDTEKIRNKKKRSKQNDTGNQKENTTSVSNSWSSHCRSSLLRCYHDVLWCVLWCSYVFFSTCLVNIFEHVQNFSGPVEHSFKSHFSNRSSRSHVDKKRPGASCPGKAMRVMPSFILQCLIRKPQNPKQISNSARRKRKRATLM